MALEACPNKSDEYKVSSPSDFPAASSVLHSWLSTPDAIACLNVRTAVSCFSASVPLGSSPTRFKASARNSVASSNTPPLEAAPSFGYSFNAEEAKKAATFPEGSRPRLGTHVRRSPRVLIRMNWRLVARASEQTVATCHRAFRMSSRGAPLQALG